MPNIVIKLQEKATTIPHKIAYLFLENEKTPPTSITYEVLDQHARQIASYLQTHISFGDRILLLYPYGVDFIKAFMGCLYAGAVPVPVHCPALADMDKSLDLLKSIAIDAEIAGIFAPTSYANKIQALTSSQQFIADIQLLQTDTYTPVKLKETDIAYLQYTSGSTSTPKGVVILHKNLTHSLEATLQAWHYSSESITLNWAPHSHVYGLVCGLLLPLYHGSQAILMSTAAFIQRPLTWLEAIHHYRATHAGCPNFGYELCIKDISADDLQGLDLSCWKIAVNGGEAVQVETLIKFTEKFAGAKFNLAHFSPTYGMSEMSGAISTHVSSEKMTQLCLSQEALQKNTVTEVNASLPHRKINTLGQLLAGIEAKIVNPDDHTVVGQYQIGEIWLSGKSVAQGYWRRETETKQLFQAKIGGSTKKYFRTGDLGFILNGEIFITGRLKELIIMHGKKYYPADLEATLRQVLMPFSLEGNCIAFSLSGEKNDHIVVLQEMTPPLSSTTQQELTQAIRRAIHQKFGLEVHTVGFVKPNSIPKTASGKLQRKRCQQLYQNHQLEFINRDLLTEFLEIISGILKVTLKPSDLDHPVSQYSFDSINIIKLTAELNTRYSLDISPAILFEYRTLKEFYEDLTARYIKQSSSFANETPVQENDIAIIGMASLLPGANTVEEFWENLLQEKELIKTFPKERGQWQAPASSPVLGGFVENVAQFDADFFHIAPREAELMDPQQRLFLQIVWNTLEDAGYTPADLAKTKTGVFVGAFKNDYAELVAENNISDSYLTTGITQSILANRISYYFNFSGPSEVIDTACSSSLVAIHHAVQAIHTGDCELAIAGGVNIMITPTSFFSASQAGMLSKEGKCKTFDKEANGYVRGEGVGALLLKPLKKAIAAKDNIYGVIKGTAINHGGHANSLTAPNPNAQAEVIGEACRRANITINQINYIETHGTGTPLGDPIEINGLKKAFSNLAAEQHISLKPHSCALGAVKTHIGHLESAAGIASVIKVLLAMKNHTLPKNRHFSELNPHIELNDSPFFLLNQSMPWQKIMLNNKIYPYCAGISSFGFGGTNAHIIIQEWEKNLSSNQSSSQPQLITLSAKTDEALHNKINQLLSWLSTHTDNLENISYTLNVGRVHFNKRCAWVVNSIEELRQQLGKTPVVGQRPQLPPHQTSAQYEKLIHTAISYLEGHLPDWQELYSLNQSSRIHLPTYPFAGKAFWIAMNKEKQFTAPAPTLSLPEDSNIETTLIQHVKDILKISTKIDTSAVLSELGFDSISYAEFALRLEEQYEIEFTPAVFFSHTSINALINYITERYTAPTPTLASSQTAINQEPIAVIGMHAYMPQSPNLEVFWQHLADQHDLVTEIPATYWHEKNISSPSSPQWCARLENPDQFDAAFFNISSREANLMDPQQRLLMEIVWKAIEDAGYDPFTLSAHKTGVFVGVEFSDYHTLLTQQKIMHAYTATGNAHSVLANRISYFLNLTGPSEAIDTASSSSLVAVHRAVSALHLGECSMSIVGGINLLLNPDTITIADQLGIISPHGRCRTFDKGADGYVKGEGGIALLLKPLRQAEQDGDSIYGIIRSSGVNHGGKAQSLTAPNPRLQAELLTEVYRKAGVDVETITYIEAHGTGTELGDPIEVEGLKSAFQQLSGTNKKQFCGLGSVKTNIGHLEPAAGLAGMLKVLLAMQHGKLPGIVHFQELNPFIHLEESPFYIVKDTQAWPRLKDATGVELPRRAGVSSFGFGGTNAHILLEEKMASPLSHQSTSKPYYLIALSAKTKNSLQQKVTELYHWLQQQTQRSSIEDLSYTLNVGRTHFHLRYVCIVDSIDNLLHSLHKLMNHTVPQNCLQNIDSPLIDTNSPLFKEIYKITLASLQKNSLSRDEYYEKMLILADLYIKNFPIEWKTLYLHSTGRKIMSLPTYPFNRQRYWYDLEFTPEAPIVHTNDDPYQTALQYLKTVFAEKLQLPVNELNEHETYEIYGVDSVLGLEIVEQIEKKLGPISKTLLYEKNTLHTLALSLQDKFNLTPIRKTSLQPAASKMTSPPPSVQDIAIIGLSGTYPLAGTLDEFWNNLKNGRDCITDIPQDRWDYRDYPVTVAGKEKYYNQGGFIQDIDKFDPLFFNIAPHDAALMDPQERLFLQTAWATLEDAGYTRESLQKNCQNNVGVFVGVTFNFYPLVIADQWQKGNRLPLSVQLFSIANRVSYFLNLNGPSFIIDTACSSSLAAIHQACESILHGECKIALAGGVNLSLHPCKYHMLGSYNFLSDEGKCASFAEGGKGYVPAEGVGAILLKPLTDAIQDNDCIYGVIKASTMNHGGKTSGYTVPNPSAHAKLIEQCLAKANIDPRSISYVEAHGTGTALGDPIEIKGLQEAFEKYTQEKQFCSIGSVKSNIGHLESAAGISQLTKVLLQFKHKKLVPSLHTDKLNSLIDFKQTPFYVQRETVDWKTIDNQPRRAGISSFGAGGTNVHLIVEEYVAKAKETPMLDDSTHPRLFLLSAATPEQLQQYITNMHTFFLAQVAQVPKEQLNTWLNNICYTLQIGRQPLPVRLAVLTTSYEDLMKKLLSLKDNVQPRLPDILFNQTATISQGEDLENLIAKNDLSQLAFQWTQGAKIDWEQLHKKTHPSRISLPTYPFAKRRCWVEPAISSALPLAVVPSGNTTIQRDEIMNLLLEKCARLLALNREEIHPDASFQEYGMDSIIGINFIAELNMIYPDSLSAMDLYRYPTLNKLVDHLKEVLQPVATPSPELPMAEIHTLSEHEVEKLLQKELLELDEILQEHYQ